MQSFHRFSTRFYNANFTNREMCTGDAFKGKPTDIWACGVALFMMVYGTVPFKSDTGITGLYDAIMQDELTFPSDPDVPSEIKDLIKFILVKNPDERPSLDDIKAHPFVQEEGVDTPRQTHVLVEVTNDDTQKAVTPLYGIATIAQVLITGKRWSVQAEFKKKSILKPKKEESKD